VEVKGTRITPLIIAILLISGLTYYTQSGNPGGSKEGSGDNFGYEITQIGIYTEGTQFSTSPSINLGEGGLIVEPNPPEWFKIFSNNWNIDGVIIDSTGARTCSISSIAGALCWNLTNSGEVEIEMIGPMDNNESVESIFTDITAGGGHSCAIRSSVGDSEVTCWGSNWNGQVGDGTINTSNELRSVGTGMGNWTHVTAGISHTCGIVEFTDVYCWGGGWLGQIGDGHQLDRLKPTLIDVSSSRIVSIEAGNYHTCLLDEAGDVKCWGWNGYGQIGDGTFTNSYSPNTVVLEHDSSVVGLSMGGQHSCAVIASGEIYCWGDNQFNQISSEAQLEYPLAIEVDVGADLRPLAITAGSEHTCIFLEEARHSCLGSISGGGSVDIDAAGIRGTASGNGFSCGVGEGGEVFCFGSVDTEQRNTLPRELVTNKVPNLIKKGTIAGIPLENLSATYSISTDSEIPLTADLSFEIDFGQDTDGDGWKDETEVACNSDPDEISSIPNDSESDGICDKMDDDDDNDGVYDGKDRFPLDPNEWRDDDRDGIGKNADRFEISPGMKGAAFTLSILLTLLGIELVTIIGAMGSEGHGYLIDGGEE